jgi:hypothetical protein
MRCGGGSGHAALQYVHREKPPTIVAQGNEEPHDGSTMNFFSSKRLNLIEQEHYNRSGLQTAQL